jgi:hypothetical protein
MTLSGLFRGGVLAAAIGCLAATPAQAALKPQDTIRNILVIQLENESYAQTFGPSSAAKYLNGTLLTEGELIPNWFATGHVSLDNYIAEISGQGSTPSTNSDCINAATLATGNFTGQYFDVSPGTDEPNAAAFPGQVDGDGCIFPAPKEATSRTAAVHGAQTIGDQLDFVHNQVVFKASRIVYKPGRILWRQYAEDMGNTPSRDNGDADPLGGTDCGHPILNGADGTNAATASDQYATRHNGFMYFHSVIDNQARCDAHVVPLGAVSVGTGPSGADVFSGHFYQDIYSAAPPFFMFVTPNLCNDGHDATCAGVNTEGTKVGGLAGADLWLKHWMPMILNSPVYKSGRLLVVLTFDEGSVLDTAACNAALTADQAICNYPTGPNLSNFGYSPILGAFHYQTKPTTTGVYPGGGQIGAVVFNKLFVKPGSVNTTGQYNHYSALRSYEDLLRITKGGDDGIGHIGYAAVPAIAGATFGSDVFNK